MYSRSQKYSGVCRRLTHGSTVLLVLFCAGAIQCGGSSQSTDNVESTFDANETADGISTDVNSAIGVDASGSPADSHSTITLASLANVHNDLRATLNTWTNEPQLFQNGDWLGDYGDAPMYGPAYDLRRWTQTNDESHLERALVALQYNLQLVESASADLSVLTSQTESVSMALLSLLEAGVILPTDDYHIAADALLNVVDALTQGYGDYLDIDFGAFAANTYGPTALSAMVAILHLQHAIAHPDHERDYSILRATQILDTIHEIAWDPVLGAYRISPQNDKLDLYPSATTMLAMGRAFEITRHSKWRDRINEAYEGIQALRAKSGDHYHSPYSAEYMGATDEDYSTLSSQNYLMLALLLGGLATENHEMWLDIDRILGFLKNNLLVDGRLVHHWMNGGPALPRHKEYLCTGCNLQTLYLFTLLEDYGN